MYFSSMTFLWIFLPCALLLYLLAERLGKNFAGNLALLLASLLFYAWGEPAYVFLLLCSVAMNYAFGLLAGRGGARKRKAALFFAVLCNIGMLGFFKYFNFFAFYANQAIGREAVPQSHFALPLGISFYTFQAMSYVIDVYRGEVRPQKNFFRLLLYISLFPQLVAGPIVKYRDIETQIDSRENTDAKRAYGVKRFAYGLGKKVLFSNVLGKYADMILAYPPQELGTGLAWLGMLCYSLQIYYDFSGYSDMAIGLGSMFGFEFKENFNYPYLSASIREFWRRWHISLSTWFKEYVYIPLGGSRKGKIRTYVNLGTVFLLTGFWHGASLTFLFWGAFHGLFIIAERAGLAEALKKRPALGHIYTWLVFVCGWVFFRMDGLRQGLAVLKAMFSFRPGTYGAADCLNAEIVLALILGFLLCGVLQQKVPKLKAALYDKGRTSALQAAFLTAILFFCIVSLSADAYNPFIYFRF